MKYIVESVNHRVPTTDLVKHPRERNTWDTKRAGRGGCDGGGSNDNYCSFSVFINVLHK